MNTHHLILRLLLTTTITIIFVQNSVEANMAIGRRGFRPGKRSMAQFREALLLKENLKLFSVGIKYTHFSPILFV